MSNMDVVNKLIRAAASVSDNVTDAELDKHVADMLKAEAKAKELQWSELGLSALLGTGSGSKPIDPSLPKPNKRFLSSIIRTVDDHNAALLRQQAIAARDARIEKGHAPGVGPRATGASRLFGGAMKGAGRSSSSSASGMRSRWDEGESSSRRQWDDDGSSPSLRRDDERRSSRRRGDEDHDRPSRRWDEDESGSRRSRKDAEDSSSRRHREEDEETSTRRSKRDVEESESRRERREKHRSSRHDEDDDHKSSRRSSRRDRDEDGSRKSSRRDEGRDTDGKHRKEQKRDHSASPKRAKRPPSPDEDAPPPPPGTPPPLPPSKMDKYFDKEYDPRLDLAPVPKEGMIPEVAWDSMLAVLRERGKKRRKQSPGLFSDDEYSTNVSARPFSSSRDREYEVKSSSKRSEDKELQRKIKEQRKRHGFSDSEDETAAGKASALSKSLLEMNYSKKGAVREWDVGK